VEAEVAATSSRGISNNDEFKIMKTVRQSKGDLSHGFNGEYGTSGNGGPAPAWAHDTSNRESDHKTSIGRNQDYQVKAELQQPGRVDDEQRDRLRQGPERHRQRRLRFGTKIHGGFSIDRAERT
jgi:hypothetical protein